MSLEHAEGAANIFLDSAKRAAVRTARDTRGWPAQCLESERKFGHRAARLYPLIGVHNGVRTPEGIGTLLQAMSGTAMVLLLKTKPVLMYRNPDRHGRPMTAFPIEEIEPYVSGTRRKGVR